MTTVLLDSLKLLDEDFGVLDFGVLVAGDFFGVVKNWPSLEVEQMDRYLPEGGDKYYVLVTNQTHSQSLFFPLTTYLLMSDEDIAGVFCWLTGVEKGVLNVGTGIRLVEEADLLGNAPNDHVESEELLSADSKLPPRPGLHETGVEKNFIENSAVDVRGEFDFEFDRLTDGNWMDPGIDIYSLGTHWAESFGGILNSSRFWRIRTVKNFRAD